MMARETHHSALEGQGFRLVNQEAVHTGDAPGMFRHYTLTRSNAGLTPLTHHVIVHEGWNSPGKYGAHYYVTQGQEPYSGTDFDKTYRHKATVGGRGSSDPIKDIISHHTVTTNIINNRTPPDLHPVTPGNVHTLAEGLDNWTPWEGSGRNMSTKLRQVPDYRGVTSFSSAQEQSRLMDQADEDLRP